MKNPLHILHVLHSLDPRSGGPSESLREIVSQQLSDGHQVSILTTDAQSVEPWMPREEYAERLRTDKRLEGSHVFIGHGYGRKRPWSRFSYSPECRDWMNDKFALKEGPDFVHIHGVFAHLTLTAPNMAQRYNVPYAIRPAGSLNGACLEHGSSLLKRQFVKRFILPDMCRAAFMHATSEREQEEIQRFDMETPVPVVPHGIRVPEGDLSGAKEAFLKAHPELRDQPFIVYLSRIVRKKRLDLLVQGLAKAFPKEKRPHLVIAGTDDGYETTVRKAVAECGMEDQVHFIGFVQGEQKSGALTAAEAFALTSEDENFGVAVVEAMAHGCPVLVTRGVDSHREVDTARAGVTVDCEVDSISQGLRELMASDHEAMATRGREHVRQSMSWEHTCAQLEELYRQHVREPIPVTV